jgi:TetR/AcrR family transcriptional repressor of bet genes
VSKIKSKEVRQEELIAATMRCIARVGLSATTLQMVTREAGLSLGIANLHFQSKENLLRATLESVMREYHSGQFAILEDEGGVSPAVRLGRLLDFQFSARVTNREKMSVWFAYYGEASARPMYQKICASMDRLAANKLEQVLAALISTGGYQGLDARQLATGYLAMIDGLWLSLLVAPRSLTKKNAKQIAATYLIDAFPRHREELLGGDNRVV